MVDKSNAPGSGKAMQESAEEAYDRIAAEHGVDEHGDEIPEIDDDEPALEETAEDVAEETDEVEEEEQQEEEEETVEEAASSEEQSAEPADNAVPESLEAPHTWPEEWKQAYGKITDPAMQKAIHETVGHMNKAFSQRMAEFAEAKRGTEGLKNALGSHAERLQRAGITPEIAISRALGWDQYMQQNPKQGWLDYGKALGIDVASVLQEQTQVDQYLTPTERAIKAQNEELAKRLETTEQRTAQFLQQQQQTAAQARQAEAYQVLQDFMNAKDEAGNLAHPHVDKVAPLMTRLIDQGIAPDLDAAYTMASANNPEIRQARDKARKATQVQESQKKAKKVRQASRSGIVGKGTRRGQPKAKRSTSDQVSAAYDKIANG